MSLPARCSGRIDFIYTQPKSISHIQPLVKPCMFAPNLRSPSVRFSAHAGPRSRATSPSATPGSSACRRPEFAMASAVFAPQLFRDPIQLLYSRNYGSRLDWLGCNLYSF